MFFRSWALRGRWDAQAVPMVSHGVPGYLHGSTMGASWGARGSIRIKKYMHELPIHRHGAALLVCPGISGSFDGTPVHLTVTSQNNKTLDKQERAPRDENSKGKREDKRDPQRAGP